MLLLVAAIGACQEIAQPNISNPIPVLKRISIWKCDLKNLDKIYVSCLKSYDQSGNLKEVIQYSEKGKSAVVSKYSYSQNVCKETKTCIGTNGHDDSVIVFISNYTTNGQISSVSTINNDGVTIKKDNYTYDNNGNITKVVSIDSTGTITSNTNYAYTYDNGKITARTVNPGANGTFVAVDSMIYNPSNNKIDIISYDAIGVKKTTHSFIYNNNGFLVSDTEINYLGETINYFIYEYWYW